MARLFERVASAQIGAPGERGIEIRDLDFSFSVTKSSEGTPNSLKLSIFNMAEATRSQIERQRDRVVLTAGYEGNQAIIFIGDISNVTHQKQGADIISVIECGDGEVQYRDAFINESFGPGATFKQVFARIAEKSGLGLGVTNGLPNHTFNNGVVITGPIRDVMDKYQRTFGFEWSIQDGQLQVLAPTLDTGEATVILNVDTGMINAPQKTEKGIKVESLLQPDLKPGRSVKVESLSINGLFKIEKVVHTGETFGQNWKTEVEATA